MTTPFVKKLKLKINVSKTLMLFGIALFLLFPIASFGQEKDGEKENLEEEEVVLPEIFEIIPLANKTISEFDKIQESINKIDNSKKLKENFSVFQERIDSLNNEFIFLKEKSYTNFNEFVGFKQKLLAEQQKFEDFNDPISKKINQLDKNRKYCISEKEKWEEWEAELNTKDTPKQLKESFRNVRNSNSKTLKIVITKLNEMLGVQQISYQKQVGFEGLVEQLDSYVSEKRLEVIAEDSAPLYSLEFLKQLNVTIIKVAFQRFKAVVTKGNKEFINTYWWVILFQISLFGMVYLFIKSNFSKIETVKKYRFFAHSPFLAGVFYSSLAILLLYKETLLPQFSIFILIVATSLSYFLLKKKFLESWRRKLLMALLIVLVLNNFFNLISLPSPLYRLYIFFISLAILVISYYWLKKNGTNKSVKKYMWFFSAISVYLVFVIVAELIGKDQIAKYLIEAITSTFALIIVFRDFMLIVESAVEWVLLKLAFDNSYSSQQDISVGVSRLSRVIDFCAVFFILIPEILMTWGLFSSRIEANKKIISLGFDVGDHVHITIGLIVSALAILYGAYIVSTLISRFMMKDRFHRKNVDKGTRLSITQLIHYLVMFIGFLMAISVFGFDLSQITILISALGVGVGFGLQGVVNNFVSGLILLFERPIREGDYIELNGSWSKVRKIGLRSTKVFTADQSDIIIPNSELVYNQVTNWTLTNDTIRIKVPVGVAYGSNIDDVLEVLMEVGSTNENLVKSHKPIVLLREFGDNTVNFELRVWGKNTIDWPIVQSELNLEIEKKFRERNIEIAFPQRDLHIKSVDSNIKWNIKNE